jgi:LCP family protein required for cell wall assembly
MLEGLADAIVPHESTVTATGVLDDLERTIEGEDLTHEIGVVHVGGDTLVVTNDDAWEIVGVVGEDVMWMGGPILVLVLGSDARPGESQLRLRADSIHIVAFDTANLRGTILGFPRDSYVFGPIRGFDKFAHHMAAAGPEVMLEVAEDLTELELDGYAVTGFVGFQGLVSALGGLLIDLPRSIDTGNNWQNFASGLQQLTALRTLQLARSRKGVPGGDFGRSANQGLIMLAAIEMVQGLGIDTMPSFGQTFFDHAWSDVPTDRLAQFAAFAFLVDTADLQNVVLPGKVQTISGSSVVVLDDIVDEVFVDLADGWLENTDW